MPRPSHVRDAVAELVADPGKHSWTLDEAHVALCKRGVSADPSSVFRALERLTESGELERFDVGDGRTHFELSGSHHEHIVCSHCGTVAEVPGCLIDRAIPEVERSTGFAITGHRVTFSGCCAGCSEAGCC